MAPTLEPNLICFVEKAAWCLVPNIETQNLSKLWTTNLLLIYGSRRTVSGNYSLSCKQLLHIIWGVLKGGGWGGEGVKIHFPARLFSKSYFPDQIPVSIVKLKEYPRAGGYLYIWRLLERNSAFNYSLRNKICRVKGKSRIYIFII